MRTAIALAAVALVGASHGAAARERFAPCPRFADAARLPLRPGSHALLGDLDGDGSRDRVTVRYAKWARSTCAFLVTFETRRDTRAGIAPAAGKGIAESGYAHAREYPEPAPGSLVRIRGHGLVAMVALSHGASTVQVRPYWLARGRLVAPRFDLTAYGSVAHNNQLDCFRGTRSGLIVETGESVANDAGTRWAFDRLVLRLTDRGLHPVRSTHLTVRTKTARVLERRWGLGYPPFRGCTAAGGL